MLDALYEELGDGRVVAGELTRGPWDPDAQHGGAPAALLMREFERLGDGAGLPIARVTYELLRPVPLGELKVAGSVVRPGRRVQLLEGSISSAEGIEVVRARALCVAAAGVGAGAVDAPEAEPSGGEPIRFHLDLGGRVVFPVDGMEIRFVRGQFDELGPSFAWFRLRVPVVVGAPVTGRQRLAVAADFPNGIATVLDWRNWVFINPDLTLYVEREPVGEWIGLDASMRVSADGCGLAEAVLYDSVGRVGRSVQTLYVAPR